MFSDSQKGVVMKKPKIIICVFLIAFALLFVSCSQDKLNKSVLDSIPSDARAALENVGEIAEAYDADTPRFINGQELRDRFLDENGNPTPLVFNSWLIAYKSVLSWVPTLFDKMECNAMLHNDHGYKINEFWSGLTYLEYCEYRYLESNEYHKAGEICFIELRLVCDEINHLGWYAKALSFDPTMRYEISRFGIDVLTGQKISYNYNTREISAPKDNGLVEYDDEGRVIRRTSYDYTGTLNVVREYEYNTAENYTKESRYYKGKLEYERYYSGTRNLTIIDHELRYYDNEIEEIVYEYQNGTQFRKFHYNMAGAKTMESYYDKASSHYNVFLHFDEDGKMTMREEYDEDGYLIKLTKYYPSGRERNVTVYDTEGNIVSTTEYDDGNCYIIEISSPDIPFEHEEAVSFSQGSSEYSILMPVHTERGVDLGKSRIEITVTDEHGNELPLDYSAYSLKYYESAEVKVYENETSISKILPTQKRLESIEILIRKSADINGIVKVRIVENGFSGSVMLIEEEAELRKEFRVDASDLTDKAFIYDFEKDKIITVKKNEIFWYTVLKSDYEANVTLEQAYERLYETIEKSGVDPERTGFAPIYRYLSLRVTTDGHGTSDEDMTICFIYVKYTGNGIADFSSLRCKDSRLTELVNEGILFIAD